MFETFRLLSGYFCPIAKGFYNRAPAKACPPDGGRYDLKVAYITIASGKGYDQFSHKRLPETMAQRFAPRVQ